MNVDEQYLELCNRVICEGVWVKNARTGKRCKTIINAVMHYDMTEGLLPMLTTKKVFYKKAIAEMLGYLRGYTSAAQFRELGTDTWDANANETDAWLVNPHRKGKDDMGQAYGPQLRAFHDRAGTPFDQLLSVYNDLHNAVDNRMEIITFWNPAEIDRACLAACMHTHQFSVLDGYLHLTSIQRSDDLPLGHAFNMVQIGWLLLIMAHVTGLKPGKAMHCITNAHIYEDQYETLVSEQLPRFSIADSRPLLEISPRIKTMEDLLMVATLDDFNVTGYKSHPAIKFPFSA